MRKWLSGIAIVLTASAAPALAHHPFAAEYDWKQPVTVTGTVTSFDWQNPHSILVLKGKDDKGRDATWTVELGNPAQLTRFGWNSHQFKSGDRVSVDGWRAKSGKQQVSAKSVTAAGHELAAASSFFEEERAAAANNRGVKATSGTSTPATRP